MPSNTTANAGKAERWSNLPWQKLNTNESTKNASDDDHRKRKRKQASGGNDGNEDFAGYNHYDDPKADPSELYMPSTSAKNHGGKEFEDGAGILFGIEVVDGSYFDVDKDKSGSADNVDKAKPSDDVPLTKETKKQKKKKKQKGSSTNASAEKKKDADDVQTSENEDKDKVSQTNLKTEASDEHEKKLTKNQRRNLKRKAKKAAKKLEKKRRKMEKETSKQQGQQEDDTTGNDENDNKDSGSGKKQPQESGKIQPQQQKKKKKKQSEQTPNDSSSSSPDHVIIPTDADINKIQTDWSISAGGVWLHTTLCAGLASKGFESPTPVQASTLPAAVMGKRDVVGAAPTGSGKTLAYALPILHDLLTTRDENKEQQERNQCLEALVLCPTRELALQVSREIIGVCRGEIQCGTLVGGLSEQKQKRVLEKRPPVLVATPGRLWDLMSSNEHAHLEDLTQLRFLVIDEADRMISQGSFPQLKRIFESINRANPPPPSEAEIEAAMNDDSDDDDDPDRLKSLQGVRGEAKVVMLNDDILKMIEQQRNEREDPNRTKDESANEEEECNADDDASSSTPVVPPEPIEMDDDEYLEQKRQLEEGMDNTGVSSDDEDEAKDPVHRQTFVYSATLTLPHISLHKKSSSISDGKKGKHKKQRKGPTIEGAIAEILEKAGARGQTKVVDLSSEKDAKIIHVYDHTTNDSQGDKLTDQKKNNKQPQDGGTKNNEVRLSSTCARLPPGLSLRQILCAQMHKDSHLYAYLVTTAQGSSGPCLVFCNSIGAVKRVAETLRILGLPAKGLHAQMSQKARFSSLESLRKSNSRSIVVATDVAARGLDIPSVATVVHYDVPRAMDTFIHRAGRTARGVGDRAVGTSISLVAPSEEKAHTKICEALRGSGIKGLDEASIDGRLLAQAQERTALATKIVSCEEVESKASRKNKWFIEAASDAGLDVDEELLDRGLINGDRRDRQRLVEAKQAKAKLSDLLSKPMRRQKYGKFLSGVGLTESIRVESEVNPFVVNSAGSKHKKNRNKREQH